MVTVYNSEKSLIDHVGTYINQVGALYIIDNSETSNDKLVRQLAAVYPKVKYIKNDGNLGLGVALNRAAQLAIAGGFTHLLMMDDDSSMPEGAIAQLYSTAVTHLAEPIGIVSATQMDLSGRQRVSGKRKDTFTVAQTAITAGSLLSLAAYQCVGPFQEDLFIDWVDIEYSFRLKKHCYQILLDNRVKMIHRIGIRKQVKLLGLIPYRWRSHSPTRLYYKFRNSLFVMKREAENIPPDFRQRFRRELYRNLFKILIAEPNKGEFFMLIKKAIYDARRGQLGKLA